MQRIRLSQNVLLEITDETESLNLNGSTNIHLYEYDVSVYNGKQLVLEDGELEERTKSYMTFNNTLLSPTPNFYLDDKFAANFHNNHEINTLLSPSVLTAPLLFRKVRLLFGQGFAYSTLNNGVAMVSLNINAVLPSNNSRIDLLSFVDSYDNSAILGIPEVLHDNQLFNSAIELRLLDLAYLYNSTSIDIVEFRERLFGTNSIETLFIEHSGVQFSELVSFNEFGKTFNRFNDRDRIRTQFSPRYQNSEIICNVSKKLNGTISAVLQHERFDLRGFLEKNSKVTDIHYTYKFDEYNVSDVLIGSKIIRISSPTSLFEDSEFRYQPQDATIYIQVNVEGHITQEDGSTISRNGSILLTDVTPLKTVSITADITEETLVRTDTKEVKQVIYQNDVPKIIHIEKPVFVNVQSVLDSILLVPYKQTFSINVGVDLSTVRQVKLVIGSSSYINDSISKTTFTVGNEAFYTTENTYYLVDEQEYMISHGTIERVKK